MPATVVSEERRVVPRARPAIRAAVHGRATATEQLRRQRARTRCRCRPATIQDIIVGVVERERTRLLNSRLREYRCYERQRQHGCRAKYLEVGHSVSSPLIYR